MTNKENIEINIPKTERYTAINSLCDAVVNLSKAILQSSVSVNITDCELNGNNKDEPMISINTTDD